MAERKVLNKYYAPNFDATLLQRKKKRQSIKDKMFNIRYMLPCSMRCNTCGAYAPIGTKYNMRVEKVRDERYLGIAIFRFYFKCLQCYAQISFKTDPKSADYVIDEGATRNYECQKDMLAAEEKLKDQRDNEEEGNAMKSLENKTFDSKREMEILDAIDNIKHLNKRQNQITYDELIKLVQFNLDKEEAESQREELGKGFNEEDDKLLDQLFQMKKQKFEDDNEEEAELSENKKSTVDNSQHSEVVKLEDSVENSDIVDSKNDKKSEISNGKNSNLSNNNFFKNKPKIVSIQKTSSNGSSNSSTSILSNKNVSIIKNNNINTNNQKPVQQNKGLIGYDSEDED